MRQRDRERLRERRRKITRKKEEWHNHTRVKGKNKQTHRRVDKLNKLTPGHKGQLFHYGIESRIIQRETKGEIVSKRTN